MTNPTSNFNWQMPTSTDLVTDLPADFEVFGQAVDTTLADLKGGTTGQILSKATNADMDFAWTTPNPGDITGVAAGTGISGGGTSGDVTITNSMATAIDAKGDLIAGTANDTFAKLTVGADGSTLVANSAASTGLSWAGQPYANPIINSAFQVWQRGTTSSFTGGAINYVADRWQAWATAGGTSITVARQSTNDTTNLPFIQYCTRFQRVAANTSTAPLIYQTTLETINSIPYVGKTITLSFYARAGANFSTATGLTGLVIQGTGTDQNATSFTSSSTVASVTPTLTTTWQRFTVSGTVLSTSTQLAIRFVYTPTGTAGANDFFEVTGVQIDLGSVALPFRTYAGTIQGELAACQRYYCKSYNQSVAPADAATASGINKQGTAYTTTNMRSQSLFYPVTMRLSSPTITLYRTSSIATNGRWGYYTTSWQTATIGTGQVQDSSFSIELNGTFTLNGSYILDGEWTASAEL